MIGCNGKDLSIDLDEIVMVEQGHECVIVTLRCGVSREIDTQYENLRSWWLDFDAWRKYVADRLEKERTARGRGQ